MASSPGTNRITHPLLRAVTERVTRTHCPYCAFQCGMTVTTTSVASTGARENDNAEPGPQVRSDVRPAVRPDADFPVNRGQMCIKGFTSADAARPPGALAAPAACAAATAGSSPASWDAALDFVARAPASSCAPRTAPAALGVFGSGALTNEKAYLLGKFARVALRTPNIDYNGRYCMSSAPRPARTARSASTAACRSRSATSPTAEALAARGARTPPTRCRRSCSGSSSSEARRHADRRRPARARDTARAADLHLQLTPGSDLALANGLLYARDRGEADRRATTSRARTDGLRRRAPQPCCEYHPAHVERLTGVADRAAAAAPCGWLARRRAQR